MIFRRKNNKTGPQLITDALGMFDKAIEKLTRGVELCDSQIGANDDAIEKLQEENTSLSKASIRAGNAIAGLRTLLGDDAATVEASAS